jgi:hypothetical protein
MQYDRLRRIRTFPKFNGLSKMKKILFAVTVFAAVSVANAHTVDVVNLSGDFLMLTDERAPSGMPLFRAFDSDGTVTMTGGYVPNFTGYTLHLDYSNKTPHIPRGDAVAKRQLHDLLNLQCRGESGDDPKTQRACQLRDELER